MGCVDSFSAPLERPLVATAVILTIQNAFFSKVVVSEPSSAESSARIVSYNSRKISVELKVLPPPFHIREWF